MNLSKALHLVFGDSAAGCLRVALRLERGRILVHEDPLSCGPAPATDDFSKWCSIRESFLQEMYSDWPEISLNEFGDNGLLSNVRRLADANPLVVWVAPSLREQLLVAWLTVLFEQMQLDFSNLFVVQFRWLRPNQLIQGMGELSPEKIQEIAPEPTPLSPAVVSEYQAAWRAYTSSSPIDLINFLNQEPVNDILCVAMKQLVYRYPSATNGLSTLDESLINHADTKRRKAARIVGYTMGYSDALDPLGDQYVFYRLLRLGDRSLASPLVSFSGDCASMRTCEAQLTDFGKDVLAGDANAMETNGIDDWIGGVHLDSPSSAPIRRDGMLVISD